MTPKGGGDTPRGHIAYIVICQSVVGEPGAGYGVSYDSDLRLFSDRSNAIRHGFKVRDSDDFNIGVVEDAVTLVGFDWMEQPCKGHSLATIAEHIGLEAKR